MKLEKGKMEKLLKQVWNIRNICKEYDKEICKILKIKNNAEDSRTGCFAMIFNQATLTFELLDYYYGKWDDSNQLPFLTKEEKQQTIKENGERCMEISKMLFIASISSIEFSIKKSVLLYPKSELCKFYLEKQKNNKFISFYKIITEKSKHFITEKEKKSWKFLITVRNNTVHNNSISNKYEKIKINNRDFEIEKEKMMQGKLDHYILLTTEAIARYYYWIKKFDKDCK